MTIPLAKFLSTKINQIFLQNICSIISLPFYLQSRRGKKYEKHTYTTLSLLISFSLQWEENVLCPKIQDQYHITKAIKFCKFTPWQFSAPCLANHCLDVGTPEASQILVFALLLNNAQARPLKETMNLPHAAKWSTFVMLTLSSLSPAEYGVLEVSIIHCF